MFRWTQTNKAQRVMWLILLLAIVPQTEAVHDHVDLVEINHYHDTHTNHFAIVDWRLSRQASQHPIGRTAVWFDGNTLRKVTAKHVIETWTQDGGADRPRTRRTQRPPNRPAPWAHQTDIQANREGTFRAIAWPKQYAPSTIS